MTLTPRQWTMAFAAALATHALVAALLPQALSKRNNDPPPPKPILVSLATTPAPTRAPAPVVTSPAPARATPPVARQPEPEVSPSTPKVVDPPPQPAPVPPTVKQVPLTQQSVAAINPTPVTTPQMPPREATAAVRDDNRAPNATEGLPATTAAAPTSPLDVAVDVAQLRSQYINTVHTLMNKHKRYPRRAKYRGDEGTVAGYLVMNRHGEALDHEIKSSSGRILLDKEALELIQRIRPLLPVPSDELFEGNDTFKVPFKIVFELH